MKIVAWNIRSGGGVRVEGIYRQLLHWGADTILLSEFRGTGASQSLAEMLGSAGWSNQLSTIRVPGEKTNGLLVVSKWPVTRIEHRIRIDSYRWLPCIVHSHRPLVICSMHVPNQVTGKKIPFQQGVVRFLKKFPIEQGLLIGDTNSGLRHIDEESPAFGLAEEKWILQLERRMWLDGYRHLYGNRREFTWYSPNGNNGFRLDHAYFNQKSLSRLRSFSYDWGRSKNSTRRDALSDHAAINITLAPG